MPEPPPDPLLSVCVVSGRRHRLLAACLDGLVRQDAPPPFEVVVVGDDDDVTDVVRRRFPHAEVAIVPKSRPGAARNVLIERSRGRFLLFLDDDVVPEPHLLRRLGELIEEHPEASVFGGPNLTPAGSSWFQSLQGDILASLGATGPVRRRYGAHPPGEADERWFILCNLAIRREHMLPFAAALVCAEENDVLQGLAQADRTMFYHPDLAVDHQRRPDLRSFVRQLYKYGRGRGQVIVRRGPSHVAYFLPTALVLYLTVLPRLVIETPWALVPGAAWLAVVALTGLAVALRRRRPWELPVAAVLTACVHLVYGIGVIAGLVGFRAARRRMPDPEPIWAPAEGGGGELGPRAAPAPVAVAAPVSARNRRWVVDVFTTLIVRQWKIRAKRSLVGFVWPIIAPVGLALLYVMVFKRVFTVPVARYPVYLVCGLLPWLFVSTAVSRSVSSVSAEGDVVRKSRFPYELLPLSTVAGQGIILAVNLVGFLVYVAVFADLRWTILPLLVVPIASAAFLASALSLLVSVYDIYSRDLRFVLGNILSVWFFLIPIVYRPRMAPSYLQWLQRFDPMAAVVSQLRSIVYAGDVPSLPGMWITFVGTGLLFVGALVVFRRRAPSFGALL